jgi:integrase
LTGRGKWVFESPAKPGRPLSHFAAATRRIRKFEGLAGWRIHDLRHITITGMITIGIDFIHVGKTVAHKGLGREYTITSRYSHYEYLEEKRAALTRWSHHLQQILQGRAERKFFTFGGGS